MAVKATIHERCPRCGQRDAKVVGDLVYADQHQCPNAPSDRPACPPRPPVPLSRVAYVPGEWTAEELLAQLAEAHQDAAAWRERCLEYKRRLDDVFVAVKGYVTNRVT